jgi:hypothetical protein
MSRPVYATPIVVIPLLVVIVVLGYLAGYHRRAPASSGAQAASSTRVVAVGSVLVEYPSEWRPISQVPSVPGLALAHEVAFAPVSSPTGGALLVGRLSDVEPVPLADSLQALLNDPPSTEIVNLLGFQAYRYANLAIRGYGRSVVLYAIPDPGAAPTELACVAAAATTLRECEGIVGRVSLVGQTQYDITPDTGYARRLGGELGSLGRDRTQLRRAMAAGMPLQGMTAAAEALSSRFAAAAESLAGIEPPLTAAAAQATLAGSLRTAGYAYRLLAENGVSSSSPAAQSARAGVAHAEDGVDRALADFALLGYGAPAPSGG